MPNGRCIVQLSRRWSYIRIFRSIDQSISQSVIQLISSASRQARLAGDGSRGRCGPKLRAHSLLCLQQHSHLRPAQLSPPIPILAPKPWTQSCTSCRERSCPSNSLSSEPCTALRLCCRAWWVPSTLPCSGKCGASAGAAQTCVHLGEVVAAAAASWLALKSRVPASVPPSSTCTPRFMTQAQLRC